MLKLSNISKTYPSLDGDGVAALSAFSLDIHAGDFLSLLGPSGCGKTTVLRLIAQLIEPDGGEIVWDDGGGDHRNDLSVVFQEPTLMPWANVADNVFLPLRFSGVSRLAADAQIAEALELVGLSGFAAAFPAELSGGMKMRVSIARALVTQPKLILMDEPFAALDEIARFKLNDDLLALKAQTGATIVFITHSVFESIYLSNRVVVMAPRPGRVVKEIAIDDAIVRDDAFRGSAAYAKLCSAASQTLRRAAG